MRVWGRFQLSRLKRNMSGIAAVEFALITPVLAIILIGLIDIGRFVSDRGKMTRAIQTGSHYFMVGGDDGDRARQIISGNLSNAFGDRYAPQVSVAQFCTCAAVTHACNTNCSDGTVPNAFYNLKISATYKGIFLTRTHEIDDDVRIR